MILVPEIPETTELHELPDSTFESLTYLVRETSEVLKRITKADKINVAALGNQVPQLHVHVVARFRNDDAWPQPVWGLDGKRPYEKKLSDSSKENHRRAVHRIYHGIGILFTKKGYRSLGPQPVSH